MTKHHVSAHYECGMSHFAVVAMLGSKPSASNVLGKGSTSELHP
jgi:hypothetical protein